MKSTPKCIISAQKSQKFSGDGNEQSVTEDRSAALVAREGMSAMRVNCWPTAERHHAATDKSTRRP